MNLGSEPLLLAKPEQLLIGSERRRGERGASGKWGTTTLAVAGGSPVSEGCPVGLEG